MVLVVGPPPHYSPPPMRGARHAPSDRCAPPPAVARAPRLVRWAWLVVATSAPSVALAQAADAVQALVEQARVALEAGRGEDSLALLAEAYRLQPNPVFLQNQARVLERLDRYAEAAPLLLQVTAAPELPAALRASAEAQLREVRVRATQAWARLPAALAGRVIYAGHARLPEPTAPRVALDPGDVLLTTALPERRELLVRRQRLWPGVPSELSADVAGPRFDDAWIDTGTAALAALAVEGTPLPVVPRPGERLRVARGAWRVEATTAAGALRVWRGVLEPEQVVRLEPLALALAPPSAPAPPLTAQDMGGASPDGPSAVLLAVVGGGGALAGAGAVLLALAHADAAPLAAAERDGTTSLTRAEAEALDERVAGRAALGVALLVGGAVALLVAGGASLVGE